MTVTSDQSASALSPTSDSSSGNAPKPAARWEDFIDIFYAPSAVFTRRQAQSAWPPILVVWVAMTAVVYATAGALTPMIDAAVDKSIKVQMAANPQMTQDMANNIRRFSELSARFGGIFWPVVVFGLALLVWVAGKVFGSKQTFHAALVVAAYTSVIRILEAVLNGVQAMVMDVSKITDPFALTLGPSRLVDGSTVSPFLYAILIQLNVFVLWRTVLLAIGLHATGKVSKGAAAGAAALMWAVMLVLSFYQVSRTR